MVCGACTDILKGTEMEKLNLALNERVVFHGAPGLDGMKGYNLGKSSSHIVDFYMIMLDHPLPESLAINIIETCLDREYPP